MMRAGESCSIEPAFIAGPAGRLFAVHYRPRVPEDTGAVLIYVPPFAEEMNRARRMAALQARALAARGVGVLVLDLTGTGDSAGDFAAARWPVWRADVAAAAAWLEKHGGRRIGLWGLRLGALLAAEIAAAEPGRFSRLLLWQPVVDGKAMLTQFLRIRVANAMAGGERESTQSLRAELAAGRTVEVAGYALAPELAAAIDEARLAVDRLDPGLRLDWLEIGEEDGAELPEARQRLVQRLRARGLPGTTATVAGAPFWDIQETTVAPGLVTATERLFSR